jgi:beta-lactamase regulating signal transducer with metallopeptidase domain
MPALFVFLLKVNIALLLFCAGYYLVLRHLTFYTLNRVYLLAAILFASIYPQINLSDFIQRHQQLARPVQQVVINWQAPAQALAKTVDKPGYWAYVELIFWAGAALLAIRLFVQLFSLYRLYKNSKPATIGNHQVRLMDKDAAPFSFWQSIFVNPANHEPADLKAILLHEQVHVNQWHTADILLAELSSIFYWFNPGIWLMKRAIRENIEFITDQKILKKGIDSKTYQYSLVSVSFNNTQPGIVNHFNLSTIKKRIIMMNAKRSSKINLTRYVFMVPVVVGLLLVFSISKADFVKKSDAFKSITILSNNVGNAVGINKLAATIKLILPGKDENKNPANTAKGKADNDNTGAVFYLDGVQVSNANSFADNTESIDYLIATDAKKYFNVGDSKHAVAFATRKNSAAGKALREKITQLVAAGKIKINSVNKGAIEHVNAKVNFILKDMVNADTTKRAFAIHINGNDSVMYYINGKKGDIKNVNPDDILSVNVFKNSDAAQLVDDKVADNVGLVFITTKNSAEGLKFKEKLDKYKGTTGAGFATVMDFSPAHTKGRVDKVFIRDMKIAGDTLKDANGKTKRIYYAYTVNSADPVVVGKVKGLSKVTVSAKSTKALKSNLKIDDVTSIAGAADDNDDAEPITVTGTGLSGVRATKRVAGSAAASGATMVTRWDSKPIRKNIVVKGNAITLNSTTPMDTIVMMTADGDPVTMVDSKNGINATATKILRIRPRNDDKASPLILVDGKEVTQGEFKNLNQNDIKNISVLKNDAATDKKYGEKAKQGVIVIELKKKK